MEYYDQNGHLIAILVSALAVMVSWTGSFPHEHHDEGIGYMLKKVIQTAANTLGYEFSKVAETAQNQPSEYPFIDLLDLIVQDYMQHQPDLFFMEVGAHDGSSVDPFNEKIRRYHWRGLMVEPQPQAFKQLVARYSDESQILFENAIISDRDGTETLYAVQEDVPGLPPLLHQSASTEREHILGALYYWKHVRQFEGIPDDYESLVQEIKLPAFTIKTLLAKHQIQQLDMLVLSTPGFDFQLLQSFPFDTLKPPIIYYEFSSLPHEDKAGSLKFLAEQGYGLAKVAGRTIAYFKAPKFNWIVSQW